MLSLNQCHAHNVSDNNSLGDNVDKNFAKELQTIPTFNSLAGGLGGPEPRWGVEEVEGEALRRQVDHGEGPLRQAVDAEQVLMQTLDWGKFFF